MYFTILKPGNDSLKWTRNEPPSNCPSKTSVKHELFIPPTTKEADAQTPASQVSIDVQKLARAVRFAMVGIVLGLSYFSIRGSFSISAYETLFSDMLSNTKLPDLTIFVFSTARIQIICSVAIPALALATLFSRRYARSFYVLGALGIFTMVQGIIILNATLLPLFEIIKRIQGVPSE